MKRIFKSVINFFGIDIIRIKKRRNNKRSIKPEMLSLYHTATGDYYLPSDAKNDIIANTIKAGNIFENDVIF